jgi:hypothetical protein
MSTVLDAILERSPLVKAAAGLPVAVATPPEGSNPFPLRHFYFPTGRRRLLPRLLEPMKTAGGCVYGGSVLKHLEIR